MDFILLIAGLTMLIFGAEAAIRGSVSLAKKLQISLFAIGIVVVAAGTSLPELANCIRAVLSHHPDIAVGDIVGSNIANIILIMGATTLLCPIKLITNNQIHQSVINIFIALCFIAFGWLSMSFNAIFGVISLIILTVIMIYQIKIGSIDFSEVEEQKTYSIIVTTLYIIIGIILLVFGSRLFVHAAVSIAYTFEIPESIIGVSLVAFGTSLPELVVGILSALRRKVEFALGNVLGSNIYNILGVLGISSFFGTFEVPPLIVIFDMYIMVGVIIFISLFMFVFKKLTRLFGAVSLLFYASYICSLYI